MSFKSTGSTAELRIGEVAERAGIRPSAVRYYERIGLLPEPRRTGGQRRYEPDVLLLLAGIGVAQRAGFTVAEIKRLFYGFADEARPSERWAELAREKLAALDDLIRRTREMKRLLKEGLRCGCTRLDECSLLADRETS